MMFPSINYRCTFHQFLVHCWIILIFSLHHILRAFKQLSTALLMLTCAAESFTHMTIKLPCFQRVLLCTCFSTNMWMSFACWFPSCAPQIACYFFASWRLLACSLFCFLPLKITLSSSSALDSFRSGQHSSDVLCELPCLPFHQLSNFHVDKSWLMR